MVEEPRVQPRAPLRVIGRYALYDPIASGGMATVHLGRLLGPVGFSRTVAIKRSRPEMSADPEFVSMFLDEARLAARIRHPNVVSTLDVVALEGELFLVMDFVQGESLSRLMRAAKGARAPIPAPIACTIMAGVLHGLHAAHEAKNERGEPLRNGASRRITAEHLVGIDGIARVLDFGVAKALGRAQTTRDGQIKGKLSYLAPEQLNGEISRQSDIYAASVVLWEVLAGERLFQADNPGELLNQLISKEVPPRAPWQAASLRYLTESSSRGSIAIPCIAMRRRARWPCSSNKMGGWSRPSKWAPGSKRRPARPSTGVPRFSPKSKTTRRLPFRVGARLRPCGEPLRPARLLSLGKHCP